MHDHSDPDSTTASGVPLWLVLLAALTAIGPLSIDMYLPALPAIASGLDSGPGAVQSTLSSFLIGMVLGQLAYGPLSDRFGRKPPIYFGLAIYIVASLACATATSVEALIAWRFVQAIGASAGIVIGRAVIRDRTDSTGAARALSLLMLVMGAAPILAPMIGGGMLTFVGWRGIFVLLAAAGALLFVGVHVAMVETLRPGKRASLNPSRIVGNYVHLLQRRSFVGPALCGALAFAGMFAYITGGPHVLIDTHGLSPQHFALVFGVNAVGLIGASQLNRRLLRRHGPEVILSRAIWALPAAGLAAAVPVWFGVETLLPLLLGLFAFLATLGLIMPNAVALALAGTSDRAGAASALAGALQFLLGTLGGLSLGLWDEVGAAALTGTMLVSATAALALHRAALGKRPALRERRKPMPRPDTWTATDADLGATPATYPEAEAPAPRARETR
ncbi:MAG: multidrug effflux MFS transporter [Halofilum sp. (in: g-proteobacteria)]